MEKTKLSILVLSLALAACGGSSSGGSGDGEDGASSGATSSGAGSNSSSSSSSSGGAPASSGSSGATDSSGSTVTPPPPPLALTIGDDQTVMEQSLVTLASSSTSQGVSFSWQQITGPQVTLDDAASATTTFTAPATTQNEVLTFSLTITLGEQQLTKEVTITVTNDIAIPAKPKAYMAMSGEVTVEWPQVAEATSYNVYYSETTPAGVAVGASGVVEVQAATSPITVQGLSNGQSYTFAVNAVDASDNASELSEQSSETPLEFAESVVCHGDYNQDYNIDAFAGNGGIPLSGLGGQAVDASFSTAYGVAVDKQGTVLIAANTTQGILKVDSETNIISSASPAISRAQDIVVDANNNIFAAQDTNNSHQISKVDFATGSLSVFAGTGVAGNLGDDGPATSAQLNRPSGVAFDADGNLYIADRDGHVIRKIDATGVITTVAGSGAAQAEAPGLQSPYAIAVVGGYLYIGDSSNRLKKVNLATGIMSVVAGTGVYGNTGDGGPATAAQIGIVFSILVDTAGNIIFSDNGSSSVRLIEASTGNIKTIAGNGSFGYSAGTGSATTAGFTYVLDLACRNGKIYTAGGSSKRVRVLTPAP